MAHDEISTRVLQENERDIWVYETDIDQFKESICEKQNNLKREYINPAQLATLLFMLFTKLILVKVHLKRLMLQTVCERIKATLN